MQNNNNITIKSGRSKWDWSKMTQIYYGIKWIMDFGVHSETECINIPSLLSPELFVIAKNMKEIKIEHFTGEIKNGNQTMIEINLQSEENYSLLVMEKKLSLKV